MKTRAWVTTARLSLQLSLCSVVVLCFACSDGAHTADAGGVDPEGGRLDPDAVSGEVDSGESGDAAHLSTCHPQVRTFPVLASPHVLPSAYDPTVYNSNPPSSGPHCAGWGAYATFAQRPLLRCNYIHNLEHGAIVLAYNCPTGCPDVTAAFANLIAGYQHERVCARPRLIITADAELGTKVAAAAWGATFNADCLDETALGMLRQFSVDHYNRAPEDICTGGIVQP